MLDIVVAPIPDDRARHRRARHGDVPARRLRGERLRGVRARRRPGATRHERRQRSLGAPSRGGRARGGRQSPRSSAGPGRAGGSRSSSRRTASARSSRSAGWRTRCGHPICARAWFAGASVLHVPAYSLLGAADRRRRDPRGHARTDRGRARERRPLVPRARSSSTGQPPRARGSRRSAPTSCSRTATRPQRCSAGARRRRCRGSSSSPRSSSSRTAARAPTCCGAMRRPEGRAGSIVAAERLRVTDTTGAGDAFAAGFLRVLAEHAGPVRRGTAHAPAAARHARLGRRCDRRGAPATRRPRRPPSRRTGARAARAGPGARLSGRPSAPRRPPRGRVPLSRAAGPWSRSSRRSSPMACRIPTTFVRGAGGRGRGPGRRRGAGDRRPSRRSHPGRASTTSSWPTSRSRARSRRSRVRTSPACWPGPAGPARPSPRR